MKIELGSTPTMKDYYTDTECTWCDGCGDYGIWSAIRQACVGNGYHPHEVLLCFDIGCHGNMSDKIGGAYRVHGLHGRILPFAAGAKLANPTVHTLACGGDGATFSEGINHLIHAVRSNYPVVFVLHNNENYGLTTGQASAVTRQGNTMSPVINSSPNGIPEATLNPMDLIFSLQPTFVARGHSGDIKQLTHLIQEGFKHDGFAYIDVLQACPTYNKFLTSKFLRDHCYAVDEASYDVHDFETARKTSEDTTERIATGVLYRARDPRPSFLGRLKPREGRETTAVQEVQKFDVTSLMQEFV
jgi:2-oxoglutarate/2-oxoacid ferredoxin oxidoreductase subunit beta